MNTKDMPVGAYAKEGPSETLPCDMCGQQFSFLMKWENKEKEGPSKEVSTCEGCYKQFWLERGWKVQ